jgi:hypothetical protein
MKSEFLRLSLIAASLAAASVAACVDRMPDQDRRVAAAVPVAKMSADLLWKDYQTDRQRADRAYRFKAIEISGTATRVGTDAPGDRYVFFGQPGDKGVMARLLDDEAAEILKSLAANRAITLKCMCDGLSGDVVLKSCVRP